MQDTPVVGRWDQGAVADAASATSWGAIFAGAFVIVASTILLVAVGGGLGLAAISPWSNSGPSGTSLGVAAVIWIVVVQWISALAGGYLTGRLRSKWLGAHTHEVYFRDTAHGFVAWAVATAAGALLLAAALSSGSQTAATAAKDGSSSYYVDALFRAPGATASRPDAETRAEAGRIMLADLADPRLASADRDYLAQLVAAHTGLARGDAAYRVGQVTTELKTAADAARRAGAKASIVLALGMLVGAFIASAAAALGGRLRDESNP
jgi:hypothetical protein